MANNSDVMVEDGEKREENREGTKKLSLPVCIVCHEEYDTEKDEYNWIPGGLPCCSQSAHLKCFSQWRFNNRNMDGKYITTCPVCRVYVPAVWFFEKVYYVLESYVFYEEFLLKEIADQENGFVALEKLKNQAPIFFTGHMREPSMSVQEFLKNEKEKFEKFTLRSERTEKRENGVREFEKNYKHARLHSFKNIPPLTMRWDDEDDFVDPPPDAADEVNLPVYGIDDELPDLINGQLSNNNNEPVPSVNFDELLESVDYSEPVELYEPVYHSEPVEILPMELPDSTNEPLVINYSWDEENEAWRREEEERRRMERRMEEELAQAREMVLFERRRRIMETEEAGIWLEARKEEEEARRKRKEEKEARRKRKEEEEARRKREEEEEARRKRKEEEEARRKREEEEEARRKRKEEKEGRCRIKQRERQRRQRHTAAVTKRWRIEKRRVSIDNKINHQLHILSSITPSRLSQTLRELTSLGELLEKQKKAIQELKKMKEARQTLLEEGVDEFISTASRASWEKYSDHITSALQVAKDSSKDLKEEIRIKKIMRDILQRENTGGVNKLRQLSVPFLPIFNE